MKKIVILLMLLFCDVVFAQPAVEGELTDPTAMPSSLKKALEGSNSSQNTKKLNLSTSAEELNDPTQMNQNFRDALNSELANKGSSKNVTGTVPAPQNQESKTPQITLIANVHSSNTEKSRAVLRVNNKSEMVGVGDTITYFQGDNLIKIDVQEITKKHVKIMLVPTNQTLIIR